MESIKIDFSLMPEIVYHGTSFDQFQSLQKGIDLEKCRENTDFGKGFYTTTVESQAISWAENKAKYVNILEGRTKFKELVKGIVVHYKVDYKKLSELNGYYFNYVTHEWADFVYNNRKGIVDGLHNMDQKFDYLYGKLADGRDINDTLEKYHNKEIDIEQLKSDLFPFRYENNQLSFHTPEALSCLRITRYVTIPVYNDKGGKQNVR